MKIHTNSWLFKLPLLNQYGGTNGSAGTGGSGGMGGLANSLQPAILDVIPNTTYTITIGSGGTGGAANSNGGAGGDTSLGALMTWRGCPPSITGANGNLYDNTSFYNCATFYNSSTGYEHNVPTSGSGALNGSSTGVVFYGFPGQLWVAWVE